MSTEEEQYYEEYKPSTQSTESAELWSKREGHNVDEIPLPSKYARDLVGYWIATDNYQTSRQTKISQLRGLLHFLEHARTTDILNADTDDVEAYLRYCINERKNREITLNQKCDSIKKLVRHIHAKCDPPTTPNLTSGKIDDIDIERLGNILPPIEREPLGRDEVLQLIDSAGEQYPFRDRLIIRSLYESGLRNSDLRNLKLEHIDHEEQIIYVYNSKGDHAGELSYRVPITGKLSRTIRRWKAVGRPALLGDDQSEYLIPSQRSEKLETNQGLIHVIKNSAERAGIQGNLGGIHRKGSEEKMARVTPHVLRHSLVTHLDKLNMDDELLRMILGNSEVLNVYRHQEKDSDFEEIRTTLHHL